VSELGDIYRPEDEPWREVTVASFGIFVVRATCHEAALQKLDLYTQAVRWPDLRPAEQFDAFHTSYELPLGQNQMLNRQFRSSSTSVMPQQIVDHNKGGHIPDIKKHDYDAPKYAQLRMFSTDGYQKFI
jgi:hypothetical protein